MSFYIFRLHEDTFTVDEVEEMIDGLQAVVKGSIETELLNASHTNVLLLVQLFSQAEKWHLKLKADISELENQYVYIYIVNVFCKVYVISTLEKINLNYSLNNLPTPEWEEKCFFGLFETVYEQCENVAKMQIRNLYLA